MAAINLTGNEFSQAIFGNAGANILEGGGGEDSLIGFGGNDWYYVDTAGDLVYEAAGSGNDHVFARASYHLNAGAEVEVLSTYDESKSDLIDLTGNEFNNVVVGNAAHNVLEGGGGEDSLVGLGGDDWYYVDSAGDLLYEAAGGGYDHVFARASYHLNAGTEVEVLSTYDESKSDLIDLTGNERDNIVVGNAAHNALDGGGGNDSLIGLGGDDWYFVDSGTLVYEAAGGGNDRVFARSSFQLGAGAEVELLTTTDNAGTGAIDLGGDGFAQAIFGNDGANVLDGKGGSDTLMGFGGADTFAFTTALGADNVDLIYGFTSGSDRVSLDHSVFTGLGVGTLSASAFVAGAAAGDADDRIVFDQTSGNLFYDADGSGAGAAVLFATLTGGATITASDFTVV